MVLAVIIQMEEGRGDILVSTYVERDFGSWRVDSLNALSTVFQRHIYYIYFTYK